MNDGKNWKISETPKKTTNHHTYFFYKRLWLQMHQVNYYYFKTWCLEYKINYFWLFEMAKFGRNCMSGKGKIYWRYCCMQEGCCHITGMRVFSFLTDFRFFLSLRAIFIIDRNAPNGSFCFKIFLGGTSCKMLSVFFITINSHAWYKYVK